MSSEGLSLNKLAIIIIVGGALAVFAIMGFSVKDLFRASITEDAVVKIKQDGKCIVEGSDNMPRTIPNCPYNEGDTISVTYKPGTSSIEKHGPKSGS